MISVTDVGTEAAIKSILIHTINMTFYLVISPSYLSDVVSHLSSVSVPGPLGMAGCDCGRGCGRGSAPLLRSDPPVIFPSPSRAGSC